MGGSGQFSEIEHLGHRQAANNPLFMRHLSVSPVLNLGKTTRSPQSDLTPWILTLNPGQFEADNEPPWIRDLSSDAVYHMGEF